MRSTLIAVLLLGGCFSSRGAPDESGRGDPVSFCMAEMDLVCSECPDRCANQPNVFCELVLATPEYGWPCDPEPTQREADRCLRALEADPCGDRYPDACELIACGAGWERP